MNEQAFRDSVESLLSEVQSGRWSQLGGAALLEAEQGLLRLKLALTNLELGYPPNHGLKK
jgi:hypothetical protein